MRPRAVPPKTDAVQAPNEAPRHASRYARFAGLGVVAAAAAVIVALVLGNGSHSSSGGTTQPGANAFGPIVLSASELKARATTLGQAVYWVGPSEGYSYELTRTATNAVFVRYLPTGVAAGANQGAYLVIATYPYKGAFAAVKAVDGGHPLKVRGRKGGIAVVERGKPTNVRVAFPHVDYQIEVYAPSPQGARTTATSGFVTPVP